MVEYTKLASDNKRRIDEMTWMNGRLFIWIAACAFPVSAYFFLVGIATASPDALKCGWQTITLVVVLLAIYLILYFKMRKAVTLNFSRNAVDDKIDFTIEKIDEETLEFTRLTDEESFQITRADIKRIRQMKTISIITLKDGRIIDLPIRQDIDDLIYFRQS